MSNLPDPTGVLTFLATAVYDLLEAVDAYTTRPNNPDTWVMVQDAETIGRLALRLALLGGTKPAVSLPLSLDQIEGAVAELNATAELDATPELHATLPLVNDWLAARQLIARRN